MASTLLVLRESQHLVRAPIALRRELGAERLSAQDERPVFRGTRSASPGGAAEPTEPPALAEAGNINCFCKLQKDHPP